MAMASQMLQFAAATLQPTPKKRRSANSDDDDKSPVRSGRKRNDRGGRSDDDDDGEVKRGATAAEPFHGKFFNGTLSRWHSRYGKLPLEFIMDVLHKKDPLRYSVKKMFNHQSPGSEKHRDDLTCIMIAECQVDPKQPVSKLLRDRPKMLMDILVGRDTASDDEGHNLFAGSAEAKLPAPSDPSLGGVEPRTVNFKVSRTCSLLH